MMKNTINPDIGKPFHEVAAFGNMNKGIMKKWKHRVVNITSWDHFFNIPALLFSVLPGFGKPKLHMISVINILCLYLLTGGTLHAQISDTLERKQRLKPLVITSGIAYGISLAALNQLWYADFERESFHFFNDNKEWKQMDKAGHFFSAFQIASGSYHALRWAGVKEHKALLYGSLSSMIALTSIEVLDGYSKAYGASYGDLIANTSGALLFHGQKRLWNEIRIHPKFSFYPTVYPKRRPGVLGENLGEEILKDYNGQTYWFSFDLSRFIRSGKFPKWLNVAIGYGAHDMVYAEDHSNTSAGYSPRRQYHLAIDFDLNAYKSKYGAINALIHLINMIHLPAPALEYTGGKFKFHYIY